MCVVCDCTYMTLPSKDKPYRAWKRDRRNIDTVQVDVDDAILRGGVDRLLATPVEWMLYEPQSLECQAGC